MGTFNPHIVLTITLTRHTLSVCVVFEDNTLVSMIFLSRADVEGGVGGGGGSHIDPLLLTR